MDTYIVTYILLNQKLKYNHAEKCFFKNNLVYRIAYYTLNFLMFMFSF